MKRGLARGDRPRFELFGDAEVLGETMNTYLLHKLSDEYSRLEDLAVGQADEDGRIEPVYAGLLKDLEGDIDGQLEQCWRSLKNLLARHTLLKAEAARLSKAASTVETHIEGLKAEVKGWMDSHRMLKWEHGLAKFRIQNNSQASVIIDDPKLLPAEAWTYPEPFESKSWIAEAIKSGKEVQGAHLQTGTHLRT